MFEGLAFKTDSKQSKLIRIIENLIELVQNKVDAELKAM